MSKVDKILRFGGSCDLFNLFPTFLSRAVFLVAILLSGGGSAWAQTEVDITSEFFSSTSFWGSGESCNNNGDGTYTYNSAAWGGLVHAFNQDWSDYSKIVFEYVSATSTKTQVKVQGSPDITVSVDAGAISLEASFEGKNLSGVTDVVLQTESASTVKIKRIYLVKGLEYERKELALTDGKHILSSEFDGYPDDYRVILTISTGGNDRNNWGIGRISRIDDYGSPTGSIDFNGKSGNTFELEYTIGDLKNAAKEGGSSYVPGDGGRTGVTINTWNECSLVKVEVVVPAETDGFLNTAKTNHPTTGSKEIAKTATEATVDWSSSETASPKYARVYLTDADGKKLDSWDTSLLEVTYDNGGTVIAATEAGSEAKNGVYVYNASGLDKGNLTVTLKAGAKNFRKYRVVTLFATDMTTATFDGGDLKQEPQWDEEYTFEFTYPARGTFEAENINTVKTKYKTVKFDKTSAQTTVKLLSNWYEVMGDCGADISTFVNNGYMRWYLTDADGNVIDGIQSLTSDDPYTSLSNKYGYYRYKFDNKFRKGEDTTRDLLYGDKNGDYPGYNPTITLTDDYKNTDKYKDVRVVCVVTTIPDDIDLPTQEPETMQVKYVYTLMTEDELSNAPFVHFVGESHRDYKELAGTPGADEYSWNYETGAVDETTYKAKNIRQDVHQTDYYVYLDPNDTSADNLLLSLPLEDWAKDNSDGRTSTEPLGYFRWYDWKTDMHSENLQAVDDSKTMLKQLNGNRGLCATMIPVDETDGHKTTAFRTHVGVKFQMPAGFSSLTAGQEVLIACDVSRYMDGMDDSKTYLVHEPTLSMRYLFHILPASVIADAIDEKADLLNKVANGDKTFSTLSKTEKKALFETYEDNGRVVVSLNNKAGKFALRADLQNLGEYFVNNSGTLTRCNQIQWYSYYDDGTDLWKMKVAMGDRGSERMAKYEATDFEGTYTKVNGSETTSVSIKDGTQLHLVGFLGSGSVEQAVVHYGLEFINEKPEKLGSESEHRTADYMHSNLTHGNTLDFNDFFVNEETRFDKPTTSYDNYAKIPMKFENAQYGFCYPQLYGQCASTWMIYHGAWWDGYGIAPTHSDYTLLKSMNVPGVSASQTYEDQAYYTFWYNVDDYRKLYDVTHERQDLEKTGNDAKYGTFLYIDAADEARTIAHLQFNATLCAGSEIYYSAYIANMTGLTQTPPQVMFRVSTDVTEGGVTKRVPVVAFLTGDIQSEGANTSGEWYQVYGFTKIPVELENIVDGEEHTYYVSIDNYSENTDGADYAIDQISFFTSSATVQVTQASTPCDESSGVEVTILASADELINVVGKNQTKTLFYRIFKKDSDPNHVLANDDAVSGPYKTCEALHDANTYGSVEFYANYDESTLPTDAPTGGTTGYYKSSEDGKVYYQFDKREFDLKTGTTYFVSFLDFTKTATGSQDLSDWGSPYGNKLCSTVFSNDITPKLLRIDLESDGAPSDGAVALGCGVDYVDKAFNITVQYPTVDGYSEHNDVMFDFYLGPKLEFKGIKDASELRLETALDHLRVKTTEAFTSSSQLPTDYDATDDGYTEAMRTLIAKYMDEGLLTLSSTRVFSYRFKKSDNGVKKFAAIPVWRHTTDGDICSPLEFVFEVDANSNAPKMELGFDDVEYPESYTKRAVRVGLEQLAKMKDGWKLHIPISNFENKGGGKTNKLYFTDPVLHVSATNDPSVDLTDVTNTVVATVFDPDGGTGTAVYVHADRMYLPLDFTGCKVTFHEGYWYEVSTSFYDSSEHETAANLRCNGDLFLVLKIVPEYVTWNAREVNTGIYSGCWHDDLNWNRSTRQELYKTATDYKNNDELVTGAEAAGPGYMPMKFTYVTLLGNNHSPSLVRESSTYAPKIAGSQQTGRDLINPSNELGTDTSPSGGSSYPSDESIKNIVIYDMLVRYGEHSDNGVGCFGHRYLKDNGAGGHTWSNDSRSDETIAALTEVYDVEKYYGNICKEIYFKPGSELRLQQRLTYEKAWVEMELDANKWYLMSTPLKGTYAGDMYVPTSMTNPADETTVKGRQVTEAFKDINFTDKDGSDNPIYSRTKYPIYQRSWGQESKVYTTKTDIRATDYAAQIGFNSVTADNTEWGHTYNDVQVPYNNFSGFSIRANKKDMTDKALIRLPKADEEYDYFKWDDEKPGSSDLVTQSVTKGETAYGRLVFDINSANEEEWTIPLNKLQAQGTDEDGYTYYLVGNPFMASIDMGKFFGYLSGGTYYSYNMKLEKVYYTYVDGSVQAVDAATTAGVIRPLQAFFVKCKASEAPENIVFNRWVITDGNYTAPTLYEAAPAPAPARRYTVRLSATDGHAQSTATVTFDEEASNGYRSGEDATALFDSNLEDVPTVFTIAEGGQALAIDARPTLDLVPFGVACAASDELVDVTVDASQLSPLASQLYVLDAVTGSVSEVGADRSVSVQPNDYGRYFLTVRRDVTALREVQANGIVVSVRGKEVTVSAPTELTAVRAMTAGGATTVSQQPGIRQTSFTLQGGVYIVEAQTGSGRRTVKVVVK